MNNRKFRNWLKRENYKFRSGDSRKIQKVLNGDTGLIIECLHWRSSPQGSFHWSFLNRRRGFSKRTRQFLAKLRDEARRRGC